MEDGVGVVEDHFETGKDYLLLGGGGGGEVGVGLRVEVGGVGGIEGVWVVEVWEENGRRRHFLNLYYDLGSELTISKL